MSALVLENIEWKSLRDIDDIEPLNESDVSVLEEIKEVLKKHNKIDRFGVSLLHSHFEVGKGEIALESTNTTERISTTTVVEHDGHEGTYIPTNWRFRRDAEDYITVCQRVCVGAAHRQDHIRVGR